MSEEGVKPSSCVVLGWLTYETKFPKALFPVVPSTQRGMPQPSESSQVGLLNLGI